MRSSSSSFVFLLLPLLLSLSLALRPAPPLPPPATSTDSSSPAVSSSSSTSFPHYYPPSSSSSSSTPGLMIAITQGLLDYIRDLALPIGLDFLRSFPFPDPLISGDKDTLSYKVYDTKINSVDCDLRFVLSTPSTVGVEISNLNMDIQAKVNGREDIWPHPSVTAGIEARASGSSGSATLLVGEKDGKPTVSLGGCNVNLDPKITVSGLGILDILADWIVGLFKSEIEDSISSAICQTALEDKFVTLLNNLLQSWSYQQQLPLPPPFDPIVFDYHITSTQVVEGQSTYLEVATTGEVYPEGGNHDPQPHNPLPKLTSSQLSNFMLTVQAGSYPFNSLTWTLFESGHLNYPLSQHELPSNLQPLLDTNSYKLLIPKLYEAFPNSPLSLLVNATTQPLVDINTGNLNITFDLSLVFQVPQSTSHPTTLAFEMRCPFGVGGTMGVRGNNITASIQNVQCELHAGLSPFGGALPALINFIGPAIDKLLQVVIVPMVNKFLTPGFPLPSIHATIPNIGDVTASLSSPRASLLPSFFLVNANLNITLTK